MTSLPGSTSPRTSYVVYHCSKSTVTLNTNNSLLKKVNDFEQVFSAYLRLRASATGDASLSCVESFVLFVDSINHSSIKIKPQNQYARENKCKIIIIYS